MNAAVQIAARDAAPARQAPRVAAGVESAVTSVTSRSAFERLGPEWRKLEASAEGAIFFQSFQWCRTVWTHHDQTGKPFRPIVLALRQHGRLVGLLPLQRLEFGLTSIVTGFGEPYQQYTDVVLAPDAPSSAARQLLDAACRLQGCRGLQLLKVRGDSPLAPLLEERRAIRSNEDAAPFVDLTGAETFEAYYSKVNAKTRKNMRNARNRLARIGESVHRVAATQAETTAVVERVHQGRERWLLEQGLTSRAFRDQSFGAFARRLARPQSALTTLAMTLSVGGQPIADQWGFVFNGRYYAYLATWAEAFEDSSPGKLHLEEVIRTCHEQGIGIADFLAPAARYKQTWTKSATIVADYALPLSPLALLQLSVWAGSLRPLLKRLALRTPAGLRTLVARTVMRRG